MGDMSGITDALDNLSRELITEENHKLRTFFETLACMSWELSNIDGGDFQEEAEKLGLMVTVPADEEFKREHDQDTMLTWSWSELASGAEPAAVASTHTPELVELVAAARELVLSLESQYGDATRRTVAALEPFADVEAE